MENVTRARAAARFICYRPLINNDTRPLSNERGMHRDSDYEVCGEQNKSRVAARGALGVTRPAPSTGRPRGARDEGRAGRRLRPWER